MNTKITDVQSKYDRFLAEARKDARKEIEGIERQEIKSDPKLASKEVKPAPKSIPKSAPMKNPFPSSKKLSCKYCGKEISPNGLFQHEKHCPENPINIAKREMDAKKEEVKIDVMVVKQPNEFFGTGPIEAINEEISDPRPTIPLSLCARDIGYVKENKPFYMKVMGRKIGNKVYVEEVELMRL